MKRGRPPEYSGAATFHFKFKHPNNYGGLAARGQLLVPGIPQHVFEVGDV